MIFVAVGVPSGAEPPRSAACRVPSVIDLIRCDADLDGPSGNGALQSSSIRPIDGKIGAVVIAHGAVCKSVVLHPRHDLGEVGTLEDTVPRGPRDYLGVRDEDLGVVASLRERFFGRHAVAVNVVAPHRDPLGLHNEVRGRPDEGEIGYRGCERAPR